MAHGYTYEFTNKKEAEKWIRKMQKIPVYPMKELIKTKDGKYRASVWD